MSERPRTSNNPERRIRIRSKRLDQVDETKLALAVWLMAKRIVEDRTDPPAEGSPEGDATDVDKQDTT